MLRNLNELSAEIKKVHQVAIIVDDLVYSMHYEHLNPFFQTHSNLLVLRIEASEDSKTLDSVNHVVEWLLSINADKKTLLIGIGGGMISDLVGFVASIFMRGLDFGCVSTTLLSMVDASIGGKNAVNYGNTKNLLGCIKNPIFIVQDLVFLTSLPDKLWRCGFAEIIKHACIQSSQMFESLEASTLQEFKDDSEKLRSLINANVKIKNSIVDQDPFDSNIRKILNFGHTFGHVIETLCSIDHGFAVSIGISFSLKFNRPNCSDRIINLLTKYGLPISVQSSISSEDVVNLMRKDKKKTGDYVEYITLEEIGNPLMTKVSFDTLDQVVKKFLYDTNTKI